jgi:site-specific DNA-cytosine methylase
VWYIPDGHNTQWGGHTPQICANFELNRKEMENKQNYRIRKLTERECFRLMGVDDEDIDKIQASGVSKSQQYKMAGNSIVVDVLYEIFRSAFIEQDKPQEPQQLELF